MKQNDNSNAAETKGTRVHRDKHGQEIGIYLPAPICRDRRLSPAARIVYGQVAQLAQKRGYCSASNKFLASACGLNRDTVSAAVSNLARHGLVAVEVGGSERDIKLVDCGESPHLQPAETTGPAAESTGGDAENSRTPAENGLGHLKDECNCESKRNEDRIPASLPSESNTLHTTVATLQPAGSGEAQSATAAPAIVGPVDPGAMVKTWVAQVGTRLSRRIWRHQQPDGGEQVLSLGIPTPAIPSDQDVRQLSQLALECWPGSDPVLAMQQLLRAASWTTDRCEKLQQYAYLVSGGNLGVRALLKLGGRQDPLAFAKESVGAVAPPPDPVPMGTSEDADQMLLLAYHTGRWGEPVWRSSWLQAAGRCRVYGVLPQLYMAAVCAQFEQGGKRTPLPWLADSLLQDDLRAFLGMYVEDRRNVWRGGPARPDPNHPMMMPQDYDGNCVGRNVAIAAAHGQMVFRSKRCLLCAATDLELDPGLIQHLPWDRGAEALVTLLRALAEQTLTDDPPFRSVACGHEDCGMPSLIRCTYGDRKYVYCCGEDAEINGYGSGNPG